MAKTRRRTRKPRTRQPPRPPFPPQHQRKPGLESRLRPRPQYEAPRYHAAAKLEGRVALITGGDSGIGRAVALMFAREGADIAIAYLPAERSDAEVTRAAIATLGREALLLPGDLRTPRACRAAVARTVRHFGALDILVNNAAFQQHQPSIADISDAQLDRTFRTNVLAMFYLTKAALPHLKPGSVVINTGSITGLEGSKGLLDYSATKGAIHTFTKSLAQSLVERRIRVNCVAPGPVWTPLNAADQPARDVAMFGSDQPFGRPAQPEEVAPAFVFLASNADSGYITGEVITLLGGETTAG
jgi:NAD(P)-dependent dehydrogenase (short-subunit alcohol dehydrogenase family)